MSAASGTRRLSALIQIAASMPCRRWTRVDSRGSTRNAGTGPAGASTDSGAPTVTVAFMLRPASLIGI
jgi:hypothetical protein